MPCTWCWPGHTVLLIKGKAVKSIKHTHFREQHPHFCNYLDSGYLVRVARLLVYMWPPTSMWTGALDLVSWAGVGMPWLFSGDAGDLVIRGLDILGRLSYRERSTVRHGSVVNDDENIDPEKWASEQRWWPLGNNMWKVTRSSHFGFQYYKQSKPYKREKGTSCARDPIDNSEDLLYKGFSHYANDKWLVEKSYSFQMKR